jgi:pimeloyl-ACP methyl ester carboxylesterase
LPYALVNSARIHFRIIGVKGPYVAAMSGGREPLDEIEEFAEEIAALDYTVILHDRRNCGKSSWDFIDPNAEEDIWESDLCGLLDHLGVGSAFIVGRSRTARVAISFSLRHPERMLALGLWGIGGGAATVRFLDHYYFGQYSKAVLAGGMDEVCKTGHFQQLISQNPENRQLLAEIIPEEFLSAICRWRRHFMEKTFEPVMGLPDNTMRQIQIRTGIVPKYDRLHPIILAQRARSLIKNCKLFDFRPDLHAREGNHDEQPAVARILGEFFRA